jgi:Recombination endonuclease VII
VIRPVQARCPVCGDTFAHPQRPQGGGRRSIYCSPKCRSKDWARGHGASRTATITKYDSRPENKEAKRRRSKVQKFRKYGWTEADFQHQLRRQGGACYGCLAKIDDLTACIDHDHATGRVRGLLCQSCNWGLGHLNDDPTTLRRLMAYLDYKREQPCIYVVGALKNERIPDIGNRLRACGFDVMDEWFAAGERADISWQAYEGRRGRTYTEALRGRTATNVFLFDRVHIDMADAAILVMPAGKSGHLELGYAKGRGKYTAILLDEGHEQEKYEVMPNFADAVFETEDALVSALQEKYSNGR